MPVVGSWVSCWLLRMSSKFATWLLKFCHCWLRCCIVWRSWVKLCWDRPDHLEQRPVDRVPAGSGCEHDPDDSGVKAGAGAGVGEGKDQPMHRLALEGGGELLVFAVFGRTVLQLLGRGVLRPQRIDRTDPRAAQEDVDQARRIAELGAADQLVGHVIPVAVDEVEGILRLVGDGPAGGHHVE